MIKPLKYTAEELAWIKKNRYEVRRPTHKLFCEKFGRTDVSLPNYANLCKRNGWLTGRTGHYIKGQVPINKGKKMPYNANSAATQFKKGCLGGSAKERKKEIGDEMLRDGYVWRKVNNDMPFYKRWRAVHVMQWEEINGPVPKGHVLKCQDGNKSNPDLSNWICIPRALLPRLAGKWGAIAYDDAPAELKPIILATAKLQHMAKKKAG